MADRYYIIPGSFLSIDTPNPEAIYSFSNGLSNHGTAVFAGGTASAPVLDAGASSVDDFYNGYDITDTTTNETRRILGYNGTTKVVTLDSDFSGSWAATDSFVIKDSSNWYFVHLQHGASSVNNYYYSCLLVDVQTRAFTSIYAYDGATKIASVTSLFAPETIVVSENPPALELYRLLMTKEQLEALDAKKLGLNEKTLEQQVEELSLGEEAPNEQQVNEQDAPKVEAQQEEAQPEKEVLQEEIVVKQQEEEVEGQQEVEQKLADA